MVAEVYATLRDLTIDASEPIERIVIRAAQHLANLRDTGTLHLRLIHPRGEPAQRTNFSIALSSDGAVLLEEVGTGRKGLDRLSLSVLTTTDSFRRIVEGTYSPVQAYLDGRLHLHGNVDLGKSIVLHLLRAGGPLAFCPLTIDQDWQAVGEEALISSRGFYARQRECRLRHGGARI
jgi:hypothetical protein